MADNDSSARTGGDPSARGEGEASGTAGEQVVADSDTSADAQESGDTRDSIDKQKDPSARASGAKGAPLHYRGLIAIVVVMIGVWIFGDWISLLIGRAELVTTEAAVVTSQGIEQQGRRNKYRHLIAYSFPAEQLKGAPGQEAGSAPVADADGNLQARMSVLLGDKVPQGTSIPIVYFNSQPWKLHRINGEFQISQDKQYYLFFALVVLAILVFVRRRK